MKPATRSASRPTRNTDFRAVRPHDISLNLGCAVHVQGVITGFDFPKCRAGPAVLRQRPPAWRLVAMSRFRFTGLIVYFAAVAALAPVVLTGCDHAAREFASDARADTLPAATPPPTQASGDRQFSAMPSLAPIVKQLRPTVVNVASRFKPRRVARNNQRPPQGRGQQRQNPFDNAP